MSARPANQQLHGQSDSQNPPPPFLNYSQLQRMYSAGYPFFTKDGIRRVLEQLSQLTMDDVSGDTTWVRVPTVDGVDFVQQIPTKQFVAPDNPRVEFVPEKLEILFLPVDFRILGVNPGSPGCELPFHPLNINCAYRGRDVVTKARLLDFVPRGLDEVSSRFNNALSVWDYSKPAEEFRAYLKASAAQIPRIKKIIAFGAHSMARSGIAVNPNRFFMQHILVLEIRNFLQKAGQRTIPIQCYAQDPMYTDTDRDLLGARGIVVLNSPVGFLEVDNETVVLSHMPNCPVREIVSDICRPAMMIWDAVGCENSAYIHEVVIADEPQRFIVRPGMEDPVTPRLENMIADYSESPFPETEKYFPEGTTIYVRKLDDHEASHFES